MASDLDLQDFFVYLWAAQAFQLPYVKVIRAIASDGVRIYDTDCCIERVFVETRCEGHDIAARSLKSQEEFACDAIVG